MKIEVEISTSILKVWRFTDVHDIEMDFLSYISIGIEIISND